MTRKTWSIVSSFFHQQWGNQVHNMRTSNETASTGTANFLNCNSFFDDVFWISNVEKLIIVAFYIALFIVNTFVNSLSIYVNVAVNHCKNQSMRMILYMSVIDILYGGIGFTSEVIHILISNELDCQQRRLLLFSPLLLSYFSAFTVMFMALDRFLHVMLLGRYDEIIPRKKYNFLLAFYLLIAAGQTILTSFGQIFFGENGGALYSAPVNLLFITGTISIYIASIIKLNIYAKTSRNIGSKMTKLNKLTTAFLIIYAVTYSPMMLFSATIKHIKGWIGPANTYILAQSLLLVAKCNSSLNAFAYLNLNLKAKQKVYTMSRNIRATLCASRTEDAKM